LGRHGGMIHSGEYNACGSMDPSSCQFLHPKSFRRHCEERSDEAIQNCNPESPA
jgi:hypothetical protein